MSCMFGTILMVGGGGGGGGNLGSLRSERRARGRTGTPGAGPLGEAASFPRGDVFEEGTGFRPRPLGDVSRFTCVLCVVAVSSSLSSSYRARGRPGLLRSKGKEKVSRLTEDETKR